MAMIEVPYSLATPVGSGLAAYMSYLVGIKVLDGARNSLTKSVSRAMHRQKCSRARNGNGAGRIPRAEWQLRWWSRYSTRQRCHHR